MLLRHCGRSNTPWWSYTLKHAQLQAAVLHHVYAVILVPRPKEALALLQLYGDHVTTQFQEERLLKVTQHPEEGHKEAGERERFLNIIFRDIITLTFALVQWSVYCLACR